MILLVGASASGKTEVAKVLAQKKGITKAITHTSRLPREGERNGVDYFFVSDEEFLALKEQGAFVETTYYNQHYYGCSKAQIAEDKAVVVDPMGLRSFLALNDRSIVTFLLLASEKTREERMRSRGDKEEAIQSRISNDRVAFDITKIGPFDFKIDTEPYSIDEVADLVYSLYKEKLARI